MENRMLLEKLVRYIKEQQQEGADKYGLFAPIGYAMDTGGKRLRPILLLKAFLSYDNKLETAMPAAYAIELFHNMTLLHDDIMDAAELRRGKPSVFKKYGTDQAILSGDAMLIDCYRYMLGYSPQLSQKISQIFTQTAGEVCLGQQMDMSFENKGNVEIIEYVEMIKLKTGVLIAAALKIGALLGGAVDTSAEHFYKFGVNAGIAFQIQDDILDVFGDERMGKKVAGDIIQNKKTYLYLKALELSSDTQKNELLHFYSSEYKGTPKQKVRAVKSIFESLVVKEYATQMMEAYFDLSISHLVETGISEEKVKELKEFASKLIYRDS